MTGGTAQSVTSTVPIINLTPVVIGGTLSMGGVTNGPIDQTSSSRAEGGSFGLSMPLFNLNSVQLQNLRVYRGHSARQNDLQNLKSFSPVYNQVYSGNPETMNPMYLINRPTMVGMNGHGINPVRDQINTDFYM